MYWEKEIETMDKESLYRLQLERLNTTIQRAGTAPAYKGKFDSTRPLADFRDFEKFPFTTKQDLRDGFPYGFLTVPLQETVRLHSSSGTTGIPTVVFHTKKDLDLWSNLVARCLYTVGVRKEDVFQNCMGYGLFTGGLGLHYGAERLGCLTIPIGAGNSKRQIWFMQQFKTTVAHILPSYALHLYTYFDESTGPAKDMDLRIAIIGAEPHTEEMRREIEQLYGIKAYNCYGLSEMCGPGVAFECQEQNGLHVWEDYFYVEIIDPVTGKILPDGEEGELVLTSLQREAMPLIRYRTRDLTRIITEPCPCGRTHRRLARIKGRSDDMLIINGVNIFPMQIEQTLMKIPEVGTNYLVEVHKENFMDRIHVSVEVNERNFTGSIADLDHLRRKICDDLSIELGVNTVIKLCEPHSIPVTEGKAKRVLDLRKEGK
jgi:phenylacetate-CoA ligase